MPLKAVIFHRNVVQSPTCTAQRSAKRGPCWTGSALSPWGCLQPWSRTLQLPETSSRERTALVACSLLSSPHRDRLLSPHPRSPNDAPKWRDELYVLIRIKNPNDLFYAHNARDIIQVPSPRANSFSHYFSEGAKRRCLRWDIQHSNNLKMFFRLFTAARKERIELPQVRMSVAAEKGNKVSIWSKRCDASLVRMETADSVSFKRKVMRSALHPRLAPKSARALVTSTSKRLEYWYKSRLCHSDLVSTTICV